MSGVYEGGGVSGVYEGGGGGRAKSARELTCGRHGMSNLVHNAGASA